MISFDFCYSSPSLKPHGRLADLGTAMSVIKARVVRRISRVRCKGCGLAPYDFQLAHKLCGAVDLIRTAGQEQVAAAEITGRFQKILGVFY